MSTTGGSTTPTAPAAKLGIEGPADPIQEALSKQLFGALLDGVAPADAVTVLQQGTDADGYQAAVTNLVENLAASLHALPGAPTSGAPTLPGADALPVDDVKAALSAIPGLGMLSPMLPL